MNNILFYKDKTLPNPLDETHDGLWFIKADSDEYYTLYVVSNGVAISEQRVKNTSELINDGENGASYYIEHQELLSILDGYLPVGYKPDWDDVENKPTEFPPSPHNHNIEDINNLQNTLNSKLEESDISEVGLSGQYSDLKNIPTSFPPSPHNHMIGDVAGLEETLGNKIERDDISNVALSGKYEDLLNIPSSFPPSPHLHIIGDVTGLTEILNSKTNRDEFSVVAFSGSYDDLSDKPSIPVTSVNGKTGDVLINQSDVGLSNADNTSDLDKPISIATQSALDNKVDKSTTITEGGGITIGGSLSSGAVSISINDTYLNNKYLRKDVDDNNNGNTLTLGKIITPEAEIENLNLTSLAIGSNSDEILVVDSTGIVKKRSPASDVSIGIANSAGTEQFSLGATDDIRFAGSGDTSISFNPATKTVTITSIPGAGGGGAVTSFNGRTGAVNSETGDYSTSQITEETNLYFTQDRVRATTLSGLSLTSNQAIVATDTIIQGLGKAQSQLNLKLNSSRELTISGAAGRTVVSGGSQDLSADREWQIDLAPSGVTAGTYTKISLDTYGRAIAGTVLSEIDIPNLSTNKITSGVFSSDRLATGTASAGTYIDGGTGAWTPLPTTDLSVYYTSSQIDNLLNNKLDDPDGTVNQYIRGDGSLATFPSIPQGTVTSIALSAPNIFTISGSPITSSGTLAMSLANQAANTIFAGPATGTTGVPSFRTLVVNDIPDLPISKINSLQGVLDGKADNFNTGNVIQGTGVNISGTLTSRLVNSGNLTIAFDQTWGDSRYTLTDGSNVTPGQTWGINISGNSANSPLWGGMAVNWGETGGTDFNFPVVIDTDNIAKPVTKGDFGAWLGETLQSITNRGYTTSTPIITSSTVRGGAFQINASTGSYGDLAWLRNNILVYDMYLSPGHNNLTFGTFDEATGQFKDGIFDVTYETSRLNFYKAPTAPNATATDQLVNLGQLNTIASNFALVDGTNAYGTWGINISGNSATSSKALTLDYAGQARLAQIAPDANSIVMRDEYGYIRANYIHLAQTKAATQGTGMNSFAGFNTTGSDPYLYSFSAAAARELLGWNSIFPHQSMRNFLDGTLITTDIPYSTGVGSPILMEMTANSYGASNPIMAMLQAYNYGNTFINTGAYSTENFGVPSFNIFNNNGTIGIWFPRGGHWQGFSVKVKDVGSGSESNRVVSIINSGLPGDATSVVNVPITFGLTTNNLTGLVPYTGATQHVDINGFNISGVSRYFSNLDGDSSQWWQAYNTSLMNRGTAFVSNVDANDIPLKTEIYAIETANGSGNSNFPINSAYGTFTRINSNTFTTDFFNQNNGGFWFRTFYANNQGDSPWQQIWHSANFDPNSKQNTLISGTNLKTVGGTSLLGSGDVPVMTTNTNQTITGSKTFSVGVNITTSGWTNTIQGDRLMFGHVDGYSIRLNRPLTPPLGNTEIYLPNSSGTLALANGSNASGNWGSINAGGLTGSGGTDIYGGTLQSSGLSSILGIHSTTGIYKFSKDAMETWLELERFSLRAEFGGSPNSIRASDTRATNPIPSTDLKFGTWFDFKERDVVGYSGYRPYAGTITVVPYDDDSGNDPAAFRLAHSNDSSFSGNSGLFIQSYNAGAWQTPNLIWHSGNHRSNLENDNRYSKNIQVINSSSMNGGYWLIRIKPTSNQMFTFNVNVYQGYEKYQLNVSGYSYTGQSEQWYSPKLTLSHSSLPSVEVRVGWYGDNDLYLVLPRGSYSGITISDIVEGYARNTDWNSVITIEHYATLAEIPGTIYLTQTVYRPLTVNETANYAHNLATPRNLVIGDTGKLFDGSSNVSWSLSEIGAQPTLVSGSNIKTINGQSLLGSGNIDIGGVGFVDLTTDQTIDGIKTFVKTIYSQGDIVSFSTSDRRLKKNIKPIVGALDKVKSIGGYSYEWKKEAEFEGKDVGIIAQEIEEIIPEVVATRENGYKAVKYEKVIPLLIEAIKELSKQVEDLKNGISK